MRLDPVLCHYTFGTVILIAVDAFTAGFKLELELWLNSLVSLLGLPLVAASAMPCPAGCGV